MAGIRVYYTSVTGSREIEHRLCHGVTVSCFFRILKLWSKSKLTPQLARPKPSKRKEESLSPAKRPKRLGEAAMEKPMAPTEVYWLHSQVRQKQLEVLRILDGNHMEYELVDVSISQSLLQEMRDKAGNPDAIPPQIFNGEQYCGDSQMLYEATENEEVRKFLKMATIKTTAGEEIAI